MALFGGGLPRPLSAYVLSSLVPVAVSQEKVVKVKGESVFSEEIRAKARQMNAKIEDDS